jgi:hypothetical protein
MKTTTKANTGYETKDQDGKLIFTITKDGNTFTVTDRREGPTFNTTSEWKNLKEAKKYTER